MSELWGHLYVWVFYLFIYIIFIRETLGLLQSFRLVTSTNSQWDTWFILLFTSARCKRARPFVYKCSILSPSLNKKRKHIYICIQYKRDSKGGRKRKWVRGKYVKKERNLYVYVCRYGVASRLQLYKGQSRVSDSSWGREQKYNSEGEIMDNAEMVRGQVKSCFQMHRVVVANGKKFLRFIYIFLHVRMCRYVCNVYAF